MKSFLQSNARLLSGCNLSILERTLAAYLGAQMGIPRVLVPSLGTVPAFSLSTSSPGTLQALSATLFERATAANDSDGSAWSCCLSHAARAELSSPQQRENLCPSVLSHPLSFKTKLLRGWYPQDVDLSNLVETSRQAKKVISWCMERYRIT